jgi:molybdate transport system permease protein
LELITPESWQAVKLSLLVATWVVIVGLPLSFGIAFILARYRFPGHFLLNAVVHLPLVLPPVVTGLLLLTVFGRGSAFGRWLADIGLSPAFHWTGAVIAALVMALPLMTRPMRIAIERIDKDYEFAAQSLGANRWRVFTKITLKMAMPGVIAGAVLGFAKALGEFGAIITFVGNIPNETRTLANLIYSLMQQPGKEAEMIWLIAIAAAISLLALFLSELALRRMHSKEKKAKKFHR